MCAKQSGLRRNQGVRHVARDLAVASAFPHLKVLILNGIDDSQLGLDRSVIRDRLESGGESCFAAETKIGLHGASERNTTEQGDEAVGYLFPGQEKAAEGLWKREEGCPPGRT
jgi:hypothetical protein